MENKPPKQIMPLDELFSQLLEERGLPRKFEIFDSTHEGKMLHGNIPYESGTFLTEDGRVFDYWLDWDPDKTAPDGTKGWYTLGENKTYEYEGETISFFRECFPYDEVYPKSDDTSFLAAKRKLDLPMTKEELDILRAEWKYDSERRKEFRLD